DVRRRFSATRAHNDRDSLPNTGTVPPSGATDEGSVPASVRTSAEPSQRYRRLPTGPHGIDPEEIKRDQRERLQTAMVELIARHGYRAVRILDLTKLARVSRPTFYSLYTNKEDLFLRAYEVIAQRTARTVIAAYQSDGPGGGRRQRAMRAFAELAAKEPEAVSLFVLGAFGAGARALESRNRTLAALEASIRSARDRGMRASSGQPASDGDGADPTVKAVIGGIREVTAARLRAGR